MMFTPKDGFILKPTPELALDFLENRLNYRQLPLYISACITDVRVSYDAYEKTVDKYAYYVDAMYAKYSKGDLENFDHMVFNAFSDRFAQRQWFDRALKMYKQMLLCEENGTATFRLPRKPLFAAIKKNILENRKHYFYYPQEHSSLLACLLDDIVEIHRITGQWIIPEEELQHLTNE